MLSELRPFDLFGLFDLEQVTNLRNLQADFAVQWNRQHPHVQDCLSNLARRSSIVHHSLELICSVSADALDEDIQPHSIHDDSPFCVCPIQLRTYKLHNPAWSLQKAVQFILNVALDKAFTMNIWSCGIDPKLHHSLSHQDSLTRETMALYAMNDVFAPTQLFIHFHGHNIREVDHQHRELSQDAVLSHLGKVIDQQQSSFFIHQQQPPLRVDQAEPYLLDTQEESSIFDHGDHSMRIDDRRVSFLPENHDESTLHADSEKTSTLDESAESSLLSSQHNSFRLVIQPRSLLLDTPEESSRLVNQHERSRFTIPHRSYLRHDQENDSILFEKKEVSFLLDKPSCRNVQCEFLSSSDQMATSLPVDHDASVRTPTSAGYAPPQLAAHATTPSLNPQKPVQSQTRSREANARRNRKRHAKTRLQQRLFTLQRSVHPSWAVTQIKTVLEYHPVRYGRLCAPTRGILQLQFNNDDYRQLAESQLPHDVFDRHHHLHWTRDHS